MSGTQKPKGALRFARWLRLLGDGCGTSAGARCHMTPPKAHFFKADLSTFSGVCLKSEFILWGKLNIKHSLKIDLSSRRQVLVHV